MTWIDHPRICPDTFGKMQIIETMPAIAHHDAAIVRHNSLYTPAGVLITDSTYCAGVTAQGAFEYRIYAPTIITPELSNGGSDLLDTPANCFWIGYFHDHFGHFLVSTLARLWALSALDRNPSYYIAPKYKGTYPQDGFINIILSSLGIESTRIISPAENTLIRQVQIAEPAFVENAHAYENWGPFMREIAQRLLGSHARPLSPKPVFLSRSNAKDATRAYEGEAELCRQLEEIGVEICHPQTLDITEQLALWDSHSVFIGFSGSAFLNAAFFQNKTVLILNHDGYIFGTQRMVDALCDNRALYLDVSPFLESDAIIADRYRITDIGGLVHTLVTSLRALL